MDFKRFPNIIYKLLESSFGRRTSMSVFGGDSWGREAQHRKRRVADLLLDAAGDHSSYRKLPSGKYACLVCPHTPVIDTPLMLSVHAKARRHVDAELRLKQREEERQNEMNKRMAISINSTSMSKFCNGDTSTKRINLASKPLIEKTQKDSFEVLHHGNSEKSSASNSQSRCSPTNDSTSIEINASGKDVVQLLLDYKEQREKELKFISAGWKRDCHGGWFRDENVEFDSDEEDPNVSLAL
ncbi:hypothetical protein LXL04_017437 [Taraxacum kok-saghyz]